MKIRIALIAIAFAAFTQISCGACERTYDKFNYESLTNERATIKFVSGGQIIEKYEHAIILYSDSDTQSMKIKTQEGREIFLSGDTITELE